MAWDPASLYLLASKSQLQCADHGFPSQAGAITGGVAAFAEGPIDFYKSQIQVQIIRSKSDPNYKREAASTPSHHMHGPVVSLGPASFAHCCDWLTPTLSLRLLRAVVSSCYRAFAFRHRCSQLV